MGFRDENAVSILSPWQTQGGVLIVKRRYFGWLSKMHPAEMFPLIISGAVVLQNLIVIPVQGVNTDPILFRGCGRTVQLIWPGMGHDRNEEALLICYSDLVCSNYHGCFRR